MTIVDGEPFFAHEATVNYMPTMFTIDFKCITPRNDPRSKKPTFQMKHNVVMVEPWHAKQLIQILKAVVQRYENDFGKVNKPKQIKKAEEKRQAAPEKAEMPSYFG